MSRLPRTTGISTSPSLIAASSDAGDKPKRRRGQLWSIVRNSREAMVGFVVLGGFVLVAILAPFITPYPIDERVGGVYEAPSWAHPLGLDDGGIDELQQVDAVVRRHVGDDLARLLGRRRFEDLDLPRFVEILENLDPLGRLGGLEDGPGFGGAEPLHELRGPGRVHCRAEVLEPCAVVRREHFPEFRE